MQMVELTQKTSADFSPRLPEVVDGVSLRQAADQRWQLALRIAASRSLGRSQLLSDFLVYIVDRTLRGRESEITEQQIGVVVFGRAEDYNSNDDNIVRNYARKLRKRIDEYFATEGRDEAWRIEIPRGGYTPLFSRNPAGSLEDIDVAEAVDENGKITPTESATSSETAEITPVTPALWQSLPEHLQITRLTLVTFLMGISLGVAFMVFLRSGPPVSAEEAASHQLWSQIFSGDRDTFIVPSDIGLVIMQRLTERPLSLTSYIDGSYRARLSENNQPDVAELVKLGGRRFTNVVDLDFASRLSELKEVVPGRMAVRYARDLRMDDLRTGSAILIGSDESNPWLELFRPQLHFSFQFDADQDKPSGFLNRFPRAGEPALYTTKGQKEQTYGVIAYLPNLSNRGHVLIVAGLNTAGTQAATTFLLDPSLMLPTLSRAKSSRGEIQPFELLVGAGNVATNASNPHVILERIGLPQGR
jgi:hypothetical protein